MVIDMETRTFVLDDATLVAQTYGEPSNPLALCLHGFPDTAHTWRHLGPALAAAGYYVVAPFMRGYAPSSPSATNNYHATAVAHDIVQLRNQLGDDRAVLIGHDWGAAMSYPALDLATPHFAKAVLMAVPPPSLMQRGFLTYDQLRRSWYMFFFQHALSDIVVPLDNFAFIKGLWRDWSPGFAANEDLDGVTTSLADPANTAAALSYYRALFGGTRDDDERTAYLRTGESHASTPVLYVHGENDGCISLATADGALDHLPAGSELFVVEGAGHFAHLETPEVVNRAILSFLAR